MRGKAEGVGTLPYADVDGAHDADQSQGEVGHEDSNPPERGDWKCNRDVLRQDVETEECCPPFNTVGAQSAGTCETAAYGI